MSKRRNEEITQEDGDTKIENIENSNKHNSKTCKHTKNNIGGIQAF